MTELPPFLQDETEEVIRDRMLSRLPENLDTSEGSFSWDILEPAAIELTLAADWAKEVLRRVFVSTTFGEYLDEKGAERGISRRPAVASRSSGGAVQFIGDPGASVPAGYIVTTEATDSSPAILYRVLTAITLSDKREGITDVEAVEPGRSGNIPAGAIRHLSDPLRGIKSVTNIKPIEGGADIESDDSLRERYFLDARTPPGSGNRTDYVRWALSVPGVGNALCIPLWNGPGTVKVVLLGQDGQAAPAVLVEAVTEHLTTVAPDVALVTVIPAKEIQIDISVTVTLAAESTVDQVRQVIEDGVRNYLKGLAFRDPIVRYARIANVILDIPLVLDYQNLLVNGGQENIEVVQGDVAVLGTVNVREA
ncbi:MAG: baseplate J/gp47 family protein [Paenibacillus macerans]|uniref:baseplate J/gp47 family protein n=1 Tax=Paenibacillus macerans TaxID=44252 RepID=UPI001F1127C4|nr:baseplate J/gp47 family protein [Paenibacillus macerans]MDU5948940.1 baseplate J/gp47 family protein [Paenibacillus macerans]MDU7473632.1 baseplate J/gp47 family protein [Paenibacillus macerans]MEC0139216.1 baseplate J/gp47 family protein [Paenibacillus macerans]UMV47297.1 baseplate J/gp47 family protein [Paenibacillus macerans]